MKRSVIVIILFCLITRISDAQLWKQNRIEAVAGIGTSQFFGDIGGFSKTENILGFKDIILHQTRFNINAGLKYKILRDLNVRLNLTSGMFHATDSKGSNELRAMEARTSFFETSVVGEYYFIKSKLENSYLFGRGRRISTKNIFSSLEFYTFTGIGGLSYNVKGNDKLIAAGQKSSGFTAIIPVGVGVNLLFQPQYNLGIEIGGRYSFSDYIEGYTSQYSSSNDVYYFLNVTFTYKIRTNAKGLPLFLSKSRF
jgi:hypothetical protein